MSNDDLLEAMYAKFGELLNEAKDAGEAATLAHAYAAVRNANR